VWARAGDSGRRFAELHFGREPIADRFERVLRLAAPSSESSM
jgi:hypothetical protein